MLRKAILLSGLFLTITSLSGQGSLFNEGDFIVHDNAQLGLHTNLINEGSFDGANGSLIGFYGNTILQVQGSQPINSYDMEVFLPNNLFLGNSINVRNNFNFVEGNILSALNNDLVYLNFLEESFFNGEGDSRKVNGFAAITDKQNFSFPVGSESQLRPLLLNSSGPNSLAICAYLFENPSFPTSILEQFDIEQKVRDIGEVSPNEFWILKTDVASTVTLSWNQTSGLENMANSLEDIILVGWSKSSNQWVAIGNSSISGDLSQGFLVSVQFVPDEFSAITFGTTPLPTDTFVVNNPTLGNYFISPNGDGTNDFLVFDNLEELGENKVLIFNKFGQKVFEMENYTNQFNGVSNSNNFVLNRDIGLPEGTYYYIVDAIEEKLQYQGFFFLDR